MRKAAENKGSVVVSQSPTDLFFCLRPPHLILDTAQSVSQVDAVLYKWFDPVASPFLPALLSPPPHTPLLSLHSPSQRVICPKCRLGVTRIQDLSHTDMKKVRQLALIDMTALCDLLELEVKRQKTSKRKIPGTAEAGHEGKNRTST